MGTKHPFCALYALALVELELVKHTKIEAYNGGRVGGGGVALQCQLLGFLKEVLGLLRLGASLGNTASLSRDRDPGRQTDR